MSLIKQHKVNSLPSTLQANSIYYVKSWDWFDLYITSSSWAIVATKINEKSLNQWTWYEDDNYIYSVFWNYTAWEVYRYDRNNNLSKTTASGTGAVPNTIIILNWLTYS